MCRWANEKKIFMNSSTNINIERRLIVDKAKSLFLCVDFIKAVDMDMRKTILHFFLIKIRLDQKIETSLLLMHIGYFVHSFKTSLFSFWTLDNHITFNFLWVPNFFSIRLPFSRCPLHSFIDWNIDKPNTLLYDPFSQFRSKNKKKMEFNAYCCSNLIWDRITLFHITFCFVSKTFATKKRREETA